MNPQLPKEPKLVYAGHVQSGQLKRDSTEIDVVERQVACLKDVFPQPEYEAIILSVVRENPNAERSLLVHKLLGILYM